MAIQLPPSSDVQALADAIGRATLSGEPLVLLPGAHLTRPGVRLVTGVGPNGLVMTGSNPHPVGQVAQIRRPDFSIGSDPDRRTDDNYGIYFVPSPPTEPEIAGLVFQVHAALPPDKDPFEFAILQGGDIKIGGLELDCNMRKQNLDGVPKNQVAHSFMLGFSGASYAVPAGPSKLKRRVFVAFNSVALGDIKLVNGGFSDDIRIEPGFDTQHPGYFRPNIGRMDIAGITAGRRVNGQGNFIRFGGLAQAVNVKNCDFDSLILEFDEDWSAFPGPPGPFLPSEWNVASMKARVISFNARGAVQTLTAQNLAVAESFTVDSAAGTVSDSLLTLRAGDLQFFDLRQFTFRNCAFQLPQAAGKVSGMDLRTKPGQSFSASFQGCSFAAEGGFQSGQLIRTEAHSYDTAGRVTAVFENCRYEPGFGTHSFPGTHVAILNHQGDYTFLKADLAGLDLAQAIVAGSAQVIDQGATVRYHIP